MGKKGLFLVFTVIFIAQVISAGYECEDGSNMLANQDEVGINDRRSINGLGVGLIYSDETAFYGRYTAELIVDAKKITLSNSDNSEDLEFKNETKKISLLDLSNDLADIDIDGSSDSMEKGETVTIDYLIIFMISLQGNYSEETASASMIVGREKVVLSDDDSIKKISIDERDYILELFSASDDNAIVKVKKCVNENAKIIQIQEDAVEIISKSVEMNETGIGENDEDNESEELTEEIIDLTSEIEPKSEESSKSKFNITVFVIVIIIIVLGMMVLMIKLKK